MAMSSDMVTPTYGGTMETTRLILIADQGIGTVMRNEEVEIPDTPLAAHRRVTAAIEQYQIDCDPFGMPKGDVIAVHTVLYKGNIILTAGTYSDGQEQPGFELAMLAARGVTAD